MKTGLFFRCLYNTQGMVSLISLKDMISDCYMHENFDDAYNVLESAVIKQNAAGGSVKMQLPEKRSLHLKDYTESVLENILDYIEYVDDNIRQCEGEC